VLGIWLIISKDRLLNLMLSGVVFGLALLTRPFIIFFFPFLFYWLVLHGKYKYLKGIAILIIGVLMVLAPWTIRNYSKLNAFVPFSNIGGLALYNSYMVPQKGFGFNSLEGLSDEYFKIDNETDKNKYLIKKSIEYIKENPVKVVQLTAIKVLLSIYPFDGYWYPVSFGSKYNIFWGMILCFSALGIVIHFDDNNSDKKLIHLLFISFLIGIMLFYGSPRFRLPIEPLLICFAASAFIRITEKKSYVSFMIVFMNVMLFIIFRYFNFQSLFDHLRANI
jgi:4-amino-4-deoxy-L-arabinose transferase-like glycosyltransferase